MDWMTAKEAGALWGLSTRRVIKQAQEDLTHYFYHPLDRNNASHFLQAFTHRLSSDSLSLGKTLFDQNTISIWLIRVLSLKTKPEDRF